MPKPPRTLVPSPSKTSFPPCRSFPRAGTAAWAGRSDVFFGSLTVSTIVCPHYNEKQACITTCVTASPDPSVAPCVQIPSDVATCNEKITYDLCTGAAQLVFDECQSSCIT